ncbi:MAG: hypothetical protein HUU18_09875 [Phycisphaerales bacterium]|nr:hypothetical protein [Phycisphaerales bacterium]
MPKLKLRRVEANPDIIPFPGNERRAEWSPRLTGPMDSIRNVEEALADVEARFAKVREVFESANGDDDRPRAA